ncbi:MAG: hypothetical protein KJ064_03865 [Anaerolineae bacterium]|nr:hypothetical protein [Anaerolineae bacterium]
MQQQTQTRYQFCPSPKHVVAVVNPNAGMGGGQKTLRVLRRINWPAKLTIFETRPGTLQPQIDAITYAREAGADRILVSGGDGTVMEVLTAMIDTGSRIPVSLVPAGTGNIVASDLELPRRIMAAVRQAFSSGRLRWWDVGQLPDSRYCFALRASAGAEASVLSLMNEEAKRRWGVMAYIFPAVRELLRSTPVRFTLTIDDQDPFDVYGIVSFVAVTSRIAGAVNFVWSRDIHPDDGVLHVGVFHPRQVLQNLPALLNKAAMEAKNMVSIYPVHKQVRIDANPKQVTQVDGELLAETPLIVKNIPHAAPFVTPLNQLSNLQRTLKYH